jgi:putative photosynthetic complex assembly protein 2
VTSSGLAAGGLVERLPGAGRALLRAALRVIGFWWLATGLIVAIQRDGITRLLGLLVATALAAIGLRLLWRTRDDATPRGAQLAFIGGAFLWIWVQTTFYGGWLIGPAAEIPVSAGPTPGLALQAIAATGYNLVAAALMFGLAYAVHGANPVGWQTIAAFWGADQLAKLNVFLGVANPGTHFLPDRLAFLIGYFGPQRNSPLLPVSILVLGALALWLYRRAIRTGDPFGREGNALLAALLALAALEHVLLGLSLQVPLWDPFLRVRGG